MELWAGTSRPRSLGRSASYSSQTYDLLCLEDERTTWADISSESGNQSELLTHRGCYGSSHIANSATRFMAISCDAECGPEFLPQLPAVQRLAEFAIKLEALWQRRDGLLRSCKPFPLASLALLLAAALGTGRAGCQAWTERADQWAAKQSEAREIAAIHSWPLQDGELRVWTYAVPDESSVFHFAGDCSGVRRYIAEIEALYGKGDLYYNIWTHKVSMDACWRNLDDFAWRYVVFNPKVTSEQKLRLGMTTTSNYHVTHLKHFAVIERE